MSLVSLFKLMTFIKLYWFSIRSVSLRLQLATTKSPAGYFFNLYFASIFIKLQLLFNLNIFLHNNFSWISLRWNYCSFQALCININISLKTSGTLKKYSIQAELLRKYQQKYQQFTSTEMFRNFYQKQGGAGGLEITV